MEGAGKQFINMGNKYFECTTHVINFGEFNQIKLDRTQINKSIKPN